MGILFIISSLIYSVIMYLIVAVFSSDYLNVILIPGFLNQIFNSTAKFLFSESGVFITIGLLLLYFILTIVMFFKQKELKKPRGLSLAFSLLSMLFAALLAGWTLTLNALPFVNGTAKYNLFFALCILNIVLIVVQFGVSIANGIKYSKGNE